MDGTVGKTPTEKNSPVCDFLRYLVSQLPTNEGGKDKAKKIRALIRELPCVVFETAEKEFYDYEFIPNGVRKAAGGYYRFEETTLFRDTFHEALIISPFLSADVIRSFNERNRYTLIKDARYMLITREISLGRLKPEDVSNFRIYIMRDAVIDGETAISDGTQEIQRQDIHAKAYMTRKYSNSDLYLGSLNASHNAVYGNIEFMIRLRAKNRYLNLDRLTAALFGNEKDGSDNPFQETTLQNAIIDEEDEKTRALDAVIKKICRSNPSATVRPESDEFYTASVQFGACATKGLSVEVRPLLSKRGEQFSETVVFGGLTVTQLSEFYVISVSDGEQSVERVLIIPTEGMPENREKQVISSVVNNRDSFYRYIAFLLGDDTILSVLETNAAEDDPYGSANRQSYHVPALYEKMLQAAALNPDKFKGIEYLMRAISEDGIIPEEFKKLYETFKKAVTTGG